MVSDEKGKRRERTKDPKKTDLEEQRLTQSGPEQADLSPMPNLPCIHTPVIILFRATAQRTNGLYGPLMQKCEKAKKNKEEDN